MRISRLYCALALAAGCHKTAGEPEEEVAAVPVRIEPLSRCDVADVVELAGSLDPPPGLDVKLSPLVAGRLAQVLVSEGDRVHKGQVLARLDSTPLRDAVSQAEAALAQARAQASNAVTKFERAKQAFAAGVAAGQEVDDARLASESAKAAVQTAQAQTSTARNQAQRGELRAPFDGVVAKISAAGGEPADPSKPVVEVARVEVLELRAPVAPRLAMRLKTGQPASLEVEGRRFPGSVLAVSPVVDPATGTAVARLRVPNEGGQLRVNSVAKAKVVVDLHKNALCAKKEALLGGADGPGLEIVENGKAKRVPVKIGYDDGEHVEIVEGAREGQPIIAQGAYALPDGTRVAAQDNPPDGGETTPVPARGAGTGTSK